MARKTDEERLLELNKKIEQAKAKKQQIQQRLNEKERKERTRRLIQVGAIFEKHFEIKGEEQAIQYAYALKEYAKEKKEEIEKIDPIKTKEHKKIIYKEMEEHLTIPENDELDYKVKGEGGENNG